MPSEKPSVLTINGGSSSIRFALYQVGAALERQLYGKMDRVGLGATTLTFEEPGANPPTRGSVVVPDQLSAARFLIDWLEKQVGFGAIGAVGHRVVHGMHRTEPASVTAELLDELRRITPFDPDHLPREIELIEVFRQRYPRLPQVACFDTAFHRGMPRVAKLLAIPRRYQARGVERYGFHGLSYAYLMEELVRLGDSAATSGRVILAHLGNGASMAAVRDGKSVDTSMGFTPASGFPMSSRSGDLDPGLVSFLARTEHLSAAQFDRMVNHESGLLGVSEISSDVRDLLAQEGADARAAEAVALFCYQARKWIGAFAAVLGGIDTLVFAGGIGENAPLIRERICDGLGFLGIELDPQRNAKNAPVLSPDAARVKVRVMRTDEELMIARSVVRSRAALTSDPAG
ncbi:MAG: acetate/propionate family kinase [Proteobacteria bacterium]|nr:acetate/propionate family kinase [Pseudomonadota bacterium]